MMRKVLLAVLTLCMTTMAMAQPPIPAPFRGVWVDITVKKGCKASPGEEDVGYTIDAKQMTQYEQMCSIKKLKSSTATTMSAEFSCSEEGETMVVPMTLKLSADGKTLQVNDRKLQRCK